MLCSRALRKAELGPFWLRPQIKDFANQNRQSDVLGAVDGQPLDATEAIMLAHGFTNATLDTLVRDGLATAERRESGQGGSRSRLSG
jgi:hypothetical protein